MSLTGAPIAANVRYVVDENVCSVIQGMGRGQVIVDSSGFLTREVLAAFDGVIAQFEPTTTDERRAMREMRDARARAAKDLAYSIACRKLWAGSNCERMCWGCEKTTTTKSCARCGKAAYCCVDCQKKDWKDHKRTCRVPPPSQE